MSAIVNISPASPAIPLLRSSSTPSAPPQATPGAVSNVDGDTVELSSAGRALARGVEASSFSLARIHAIRTEIEAGTYETPERLRVTASRLLNALTA